MPLSPEITKIPEIIGKFNQAGLTAELIVALAKGEKGRDLISDAKRLVAEFGGEELIDTRGVENIPGETGCLLVFNHPNINILLPAILDLVVKIHDIGGHRPSLLMSAEIPLFGKLNESYPLPGSISLLKRFHQLYSNNIISVPISTARKDYHSGRLMALRKAVSSLKKGNIVLISPEGHVEMNNEISPPETFHSGSGGLSIIASRINVPTVPVGIWEDKDMRKIRVEIGDPFVVQTNRKSEAVRELMWRIAQTMPKELRGPLS